MRMRIVNLLVLILFIACAAAALIEHRQREPAPTTARRFDDVEVKALDSVNGTTARVSTRLVEITVTPTSVSRSSPTTSAASAAAASAQIGIAQAVLIILGGSTILLTGIL